MLNKNKSLTSALIPNEKISAIYSEKNWAVFLNGLHNKTFYGSNFYLIVIS
jgi:hypothetical protein